MSDMIHGFDENKNTVDVICRKEFNLYKEGMNEKFITLQNDKFYYAGLMGENVVHIADEVTDMLAKIFSALRENNMITQETYETYINEINGIKNTYITTITTCISKLEGQS